MIFNTHPSQSYAGSKMYARVYKPAAQALAYILEPACLFCCGRGRKTNVLFLRDVESVNEVMSYDNYQLGIIKDNHLRFYSAYWRMLRAPEMLIDKVNPL